MSFINTITQRRELALDVLSDADIMSKRTLQKTFVPIFFSYREKSFQILVSVNFQICLLKLWKS